MKNLITGGAGFIGSHLAEKLLMHGEEVRIIDDLSTGSMDNIEHLKPNRRFSCHIDTTSVKAERDIDAFCLSSFGAYMVFRF